MSPGSITVTVVADQGDGGGYIQTGELPMDDFADLAPTAAQVEARVSVSLTEALEAFGQRKVGVTVTLTCGQTVEKLAKAQRLAYAAARECLADVSEEFR